MKKLKIVHVLFNLHTGGAETMLIDIMNRQVAQGDDVTLLLINDGHSSELLETISKDVKIRELHRPVGSKNPIWLWRYKRALGADKPDIVHMHNAKALGMLYGSHSYKVVFTYHNCNAPNPYSQRADILCAISQAVQASVAQRGEGSAQVVYNGIDTSLINCRCAGPMRPSPRIVQIGSLNKEIKGQHIAIEALSLMKHGATIDFYGSGKSKDELQQLARRFNLGDRVRFVGNVSRSELYAALPGYDAAILPSLDEGFGLALAEPMAAGLPVVCSNLPGPMELIVGNNDRKYGIATPAGNAKALAAALDGIFDSYDQAQIHALEARKHIQTHFDIAATVNGYKQIYING